MSLISVMRVLLFFVLAVVVAVILATLVQTQFNLYELQKLGMQILPADRIDSSLKDLVNFSPLMAILVAVTFFFALPVAEGVARILKPWRLVVYFLAGAVGLWVAFQAVNWYAPPPVFIAANRELPGTLSMMAAVGIGSGLFGRLVRPRSRRGLRVLG